tara:strand:- start:358 stop:564 length:207 start_codon:yes stop_codon:yes gene_type:complete
MKERNQKPNDQPTQATFASHSANTHGHTRETTGKRDQPPLPPGHPEVWKHIKAESTLNLKPNQQPGRI